MKHIWKKTKKLCKFFQADCEFCFRLRREMKCGGEKKNCIKPKVFKVEETKRCFGNGTYQITKAIYVSGNNHRRPV